MLLSVYYQHRLKLIYRADEDSDDRTINRDEVSISKEYKSYVEKHYTRQTELYHLEL
jgi:hypothetical protein